MEVILLAKAIADREDARLYFESQQEGLFSRFDEKVEEALERISRFPRLSQRLVRGYRMCQLKVFRKYGILYKIRKRLVFVHGVIHLQRGRRFWRERLQ